RRRRRAGRAPAPGRDRNRGAPRPRGADRGGHAFSGRHRGRRHRGRRRAAADARGGARRAARAAREQGAARDRRAAAARGGARERRVPAAARQRAQCHLPVPAAAAGARRAAARRAPDPADVLRRTLPPVAARAPGPGDARAGVRAPELEHGAQDLGGFGDAHEQGARADRGVPPVRRGPGAGRGGDPSAERGAFDGGVRRRLGAGAARQPGHARADRARARLARAHRLGRRADRSRGDGAPRLRRARPRALSVPAPGVRGGGRGRHRSRGAQCRQRSRGRGVPRAPHRLYRHRAGDRRRARAGAGRARRHPRGGARGRRRRAARGRGTDRPGSRSKAGSVMTSFFVYIIAFVVALGILIVVHEFGHFWVARLMCVRVLRFSVGFGKPLWRREFGRDRTELVVAGIPLGGYVKMLDETEGPVPPAEAHRAYNRQPVWKRMPIIAAGPVFNLVFAVLAYWLVNVTGIEGVRPVVGQVAPESIAARAGFEPGDEVLAIDGREVRIWGQRRLYLFQRALDGEAVEVEVRTPRGEVVTRRLDLGQVPTAAIDANLIERGIGLYGYLPQLLPVVGGLEPGPAQAAGLEVGDRFVAIEGRPVEGWQDVVTRIRARPGQPTRVTVARAGRELTLTLTPEPVTVNGETIGRINVRPEITEVPPHMRTQVRLGPL